jgi:hypothetical protein
MPTAEHKVRKKEFNRILMGGLLDKLKAGGIIPHVPNPGKPPYPSFLKGFLGGHGRAVDKFQQRLFLGFWTKNHPKKGKKGTKSSKPWL